MKYKECEMQRMFLSELQILLNIKNDIGNPEDKNRPKDDDNNNNKQGNNDFSDDEEEEEEEKEEENVNVNKKQEEKVNDNKKDEEKANDNKKEEEKNIRLKSLFEIAGNYVFTADNYFKMALILLRIRARIPVIMMGETGCGKTSLIRKLSELLNNGDQNKMKILNIHAGTSDKEIIKFLDKKVIPDAEILEKEEKEKAKKLKETDKGFIYDEKKLWVFLDEINTCKSMGLITEILCKHTYQGKSIPSNVAFIAACNPYRYDEKKIKQYGLKAKDAKKNIGKSQKFIYK